MESDHHLSPRVRADASDDIPNEAYARIAGAGEEYARRAVRFSARSLNNTSDMLDLFSNIMS